MQIKTINSETLQKIKKIFWSVFVCMIFYACKIDSKSDGKAPLKGAALFPEQSRIVESVLTKPIAKESWYYFLPYVENNPIVKHQYYWLSYNEQAEQAEWLAYELKKEYLKNNDFRRPYFIEDPLVRSRSADWKNYKKSGYDKGHLCPAGDMQFDRDAYNDTFYTSNITPQLHDFNGGIWNRLEQKVRYWANRYNRIIVITGGILNDSNQRIGYEKVVVPQLFYKIIFKIDENGQPRSIAFLMPNRKSIKALYEYVVSVDAIEKLTGIDFFPKLEDKLENELEKNTNYELWISN